MKLNQEAITVIENLLDQRVPVEVHLEKDKVVIVEVTRKVRGKLDKE